MLYICLETKCYYIYFIISNLLIVYYKPSLMMCYYRYWRSYQIIMPHGTNNKVVSSVEGQQLTAGGIF